MTKKTILFFLFILFSTTVLAQHTANRASQEQGTAAHPSALHATMNKAEPFDAVSDTTIKTEDYQELKEDEETDEHKISIRPTIIPCDALYMGTWNNHRVKKAPIDFGKIPDQVIIRLVCARKQQGFSFPCKGRKSSNYGLRWGRSHNGVDFAANVGDSIVAAFDGVVRMAKYNGGYGNMIVIRHWNNLETLYGHLSAYKVEVGQTVKAGQLIGLAGNTGRSTGPHLHFETRFLYEPFDPEWILDIESRGLRNEILILDRYFFGADKPGRKQQMILSNLAKIHHPITPAIQNTKKSKKEKPSIVPDFQVIYKCTNNLPQRIDPDLPWTERRYYRPKNDETLPNIASQYNISLQDLRAVNNTPSDFVPAGTKIRVK